MYAILSQRPDLNGDGVLDSIGSDTEWTDGKTGEMHEPKTGFAAPDPAPQTVFLQPRELDGIARRLTDLDDDGDADVIVAGGPIGHL